MLKLPMIFGALAGLMVFLSYLAADHASGHMPFSGYAEEKFWGRISLGCLILAAIFVGLALFSG